MALVYSVTASMDFSMIAAHMHSIDKLPVVLLAGFGLMIVGVGFKLSIVPFHMWAADVYEGAPVPVAAFIATISKGGMVVLLVRFFAMVNGHAYSVLITMFSVVAIASMVIGNLLALQQNNVKRILAYSSIAHMGYILVAFLAGGKLGIEAVTFYLVAYFATSLGSFGIIAMLSDQDRDADQLEDYQGLFWRRPWTASIFTAMLLSLAGIPLTAGFIGKFYILSAGVGNHQWLLAFVLVVSSVIGLFYYIRIIACMFEQQSEERTFEKLHTKVYLLNGITVLLLATIIVWLGLYPDGVIELIRACLR
jgi:NADH-quinone oxidoreductase subunit N